MPVYTLTHLHIKGGFGLALPETTLYAAIVFKCVNPGGRALEIALFRRF